MYVYICECIFTHICVYVFYMCICEYVLCIPIVVYSFFILCSTVQEPSTLWVCLQKMLNAQ